MTHVDTEAAWAQLKTDLALLLDSMGEGQSMTMAVRKRSHFVRAIRLAGAGLRIEAVSNGHLPAAERLDLEALGLLEDLGWHAPTHFADQGEVSISGSTHHFVDRFDRWTGAEISSVLIRTLRGVYEVASTDDLVCSTDSAPTAIGWTSPAAPMLQAAGIGREAQTDEMLADILDGLSAVTRIGSVLPVEHTDRVTRILASDGLLTVFYDAANRLVRAAVPVIGGFQATAPALLAMNDCARPIRCGRLEWRDGTVYALVDLPAVPTVGSLLARYLDSIRAGMEGMRDTLAPYTIEFEANADKPDHQVTGKPTP